MASGPQVALICQRRDLDETPEEGLSSSQLHESIKKPRGRTGLMELLEGEVGPGRGEQQQGEGWEVSGVWG